MYSPFRSAMQLIKRHLMVIGAFGGCCFASMDRCCGKTLAVFYAMDEDPAALLEVGATKVRNFTVGTTSVQQLALSGHTVYAVKMGSGNVQTCLAAQALLAKHKCDLVISIGPVGDIKGNLKQRAWYRVNEVVA